MWPGCRADCPYYLSYLSLLLVLALIGWSCVAVHSSELRILTYLVSQSLYRSRTIWYDRPYAIDLKKCCLAVQVLLVLSLQYLMWSGLVCSVRACACVRVCVCVVMCVRPFAAQFAFQTKYVALVDGVIERIVIFL